MIAKLKKDVAIWNINSFGEFYMQIAEKYKKDYLKAIERIGEVREKFFVELNTIPYIKAFHSEANYSMCDLTDGVKIGQQKRQMFGLCYKTAIGNDSDGSRKFGDWFFMRRVKQALSLQFFLKLLTCRV